MQGYVIALLNDDGSLDSFVVDVSKEKQTELANATFFQDRQKTRERLANLQSVDLSKEYRIFAVKRELVAIAPSEIPALAPTPIITPTPVTTTPTS